MKQVPLWFPLAIGCFCTALLSAIWPFLHLFTFSPLLALAYHRLNLEKSLWLAACIGLILDLFSSDLRLGIQALTLSLSTLALYKQKRHFFEDKPLSICLFTGLISIVSTLIEWLLIPLSGSSLPLSTTLVMTDLFVLPLADALYAFVCFYCPLTLYTHIAKVGWKPFCLRLLTYLPSYKPKKEESSPCN